MVLEGVLSIILNKFLGDYVENLDTEQLNVGIWGGDVKLSNLIIKSSALNDLDLPIQCVYGTIGKLVLKIPYKSIYSSPTIICVEDIYLLVVPNQDVTYDADKEMKNLLDIKRRDILRIEEAKKAEADKDKPKADPNFTERLVANIIKNVQFQVKNIHIRYEDRVTNPLAPFAVGFTLNTLDVASTDENWQKAIAKEVSKIYKILELDGLSVYWNCNTQLYGNLPPSEMIKKLMEDIISKDNIPSNYTYILGPINSSARLRMNQRPEIDTPAFSIPKIHFNLDMEKLFIGVSKAQYRDLITLVDSLGRMAKGVPYRKYRPNVNTYRDHYKEWWYFAYVCVLNDIKRKNNNWDYNHMKKYRDSCREYKEMYKKYIKKLLKGPELTRFDDLERELDLSSIVILRGQVEMDIERQTKQDASKSWFSKWWGSQPSSDTNSAGADIMKEFQKEMTSEEKEKLYKAIGYTDGALPEVYPIQFIDNSGTFLLRKLEIMLWDESNAEKTILLTHLNIVKLKVDTRGAASSLKVNVRIDDLQTLGMRQEDFVPEMVNSENDQSRHGLLEVTFETNPLDGKCDQRIELVAKPIRIVYDAQTINKIIDVFKVPENSDLDQIQAAAGSGLFNVKEMTSTGMAHTIETHARLDINVDLSAPYVIIPYGGKYTGEENVLVLNLGRLKMYSLEKQGDSLNVRKMYNEGIDQEDIFKQLTERSYDRFKLEFTDLQILVAQSDEDWKTAISQSVTTDMHMLDPLNLSIVYSRCLILDDPRLPHNTLTGELPSININISEARVMLLAVLGTSIPLPTSDVSEPQPLMKESRGSSRMLLKYKEIQESAKKTKRLLPADTDRKEFVQFTTLEAKFVMSELSAIIYVQESIDSKSSQLACFKVNSLECNMVQRTYTTQISLLLGSILLQQNRNSDIIKIISTPLWDTQNEYLFKVQFTQVDVKSPELHSIYKSCETNLHLDFRYLDIILHQEGLLSLIQFSTDLQSQITELTQLNESDRIATTKPSRQMSTISEISEVYKSVTAKKTKSIPLIVETIKFKLKAELQELSVKIATDKDDISSIAIRGVTSEIIVKNTYTQVIAKLREIAVMDLNKSSLYNVIMSCTEDDALKAQVVLNNLETESNKPDIDVTVKLGGVRIVFLNWFVSNVLNFLNQFQAAQEAIINASQAAAVTAKENMRDVYAKATKISLNINLKAPDIIVPVDSKSYDALFLDLGVISLANSFLILDIKNEDGFSAVVDELKVNLSDLKMSVIKVNNKFDIIKENALVAPINFDIVIKRNLSASWYNAVPDMDISGKIKTIELLLRQSDYKLIMSILSGNLDEGKISTSEAVSEKPSTYKNLVTTASIEATASSVQDIPKKEKIHVFLKFNFLMEKLIINLYSNTKQKDSASERQDTFLARVSLELLSVKGRILTDQSIVASIILVNCLLDDMRKGREGKLTRLIERSLGDGDTPSTYASTESLPPMKSMIDITYQQKEEDMFVDIRICSFTIILSVEYLLKLADFFNNEQPLEQNKETQTKSFASFTTKPSASKSRVALATSQMIKEKKQPQMTVNIKLEKPDIILVEHMNNIDTKAIILNSEILLKLRVSGDHQVVNGVIKDLQLYSCNYNPAHRVETRADILRPVVISLAGSTPEDKGLHLELLVTDIRLSVSPTTIELLNRVMVTLTADDTSEDVTSQETFDYIDLWKQQSFVDSDYWFLKTDSALEVLEESISSDDSLSRPVLQELCIISMPSIVITIEAGVGKKTLPMLLFETSFKGCARNWSSQLGVEVSLTMQMGYYNSRLALWEPLIEPVQVSNDNKLRYVPWELKMELSKNELEDVIPSPSSDAGGENQPQQVTNIDITSENTLELTVTKTCLETMQKLGKAFATAMQTESTIKHTSEEHAPFKVLNDIGQDITLLLEKGSFRIAEGGSLADINKSAAVPLQLKLEEPAGSILQLSEELTASSQKTTHFLYAKINSINWELALPVLRADKRFFMLNYRGDGHDNWGIVSDIIVEDGVTIITLRSIIQVYNHFNIPVEVYYMTSKGNELELVGAVQPNGSLNVPLKGVYTPTSELFFTVAGYSITCAPYVWKDLQTKLSVTKLLQCPHKDNTKDEVPFIFKAVGETEQIYFENTSRRTMTSTCYNIHLRPAVILMNCLPIDIICCVDEGPDEFTVKPGDKLQLPNIDPGRNVLVIRLPEYLEKEWSCRHEISAEHEEFSVWTFNSYDSAAKMTLDLGMHTLDKNGSLIMSLYCPFWMLNKTGLMIGYRCSDENLNVLYHPAQFKGPILFSFNPKNFFGKKKAAIRVEHGEWSDKFSLDVAGSSGLVTCKTNEKVYQIGVHIQLTFNTLTKQVTFMPYYVIINNAPFSIECQESDRSADPWTLVEPKSCSALWPLSGLEDKMLHLRVPETQEVTAKFLYTESHNTLLRLNNKYGGINVDIQLTEGAIYINIAPYADGSAPALLVNHSDVEIKYWEKDSIQQRSLEPKNTILYTWDNPSGPRVLCWDKGNKKEVTSDLRRDGIGEYNLDDHTKIYWASFLDGMQRTLLFTPDRSIAEEAQSSTLSQNIQQEINVSIHGLGLSLVNNEYRQEVMYIGIASSGIIWETSKMNGKRFKPFGGKESTHLEAAFQTYLVKQQNNEEDASSRVTLMDGKMLVDFEAGIMIKPIKRRIRRTFQTGLWMQMKTSLLQTHLHAKINRLQIDNQMFDCIFPVVLAPVPPPKSVAVDSGIKPFVEISILQLVMKNSQIRQFMYFKVLVQEFHIKVDMGFVNAFFEFLEEGDGSEEEQKQLFLTDMNLVNEPLYLHASLQSIQEQKSFYDLLHFSPLKIHISFSMASGSSAGQSSSTPNFLNILLQSIGVTLTDLQDVVFRLSYFEREFIFLTQKQLISEATSHYVGQTVKQLYVLVLGLDVIGNPYGLVLGITKGVEDLFYEPFQGAIQGPGEFAEGLALGVKSLVGHTVGGAAGAVSRITGAMGKGIAALTFDEDYQRKRREALRKQPSTVHEGFARSGKGLVMGVYSGVTGVFTKPVEGAKEQGVEGFFKGLGKGAVGLVTRPVAGVVDFASGSLDAVKRCADNGEETHRLRPPRFLQADCLVRPYNLHEAEGHKMLNEMSKGKYSTTDVYVGHYEVVKKKEVLLLTDKRVAYVCHNDIFGGWQIEWSYTWDEIPQPPKVVPKGVLLTTTEKKKKFFSSGETTKTILIDNPSIKEEICLKMDSLRSA